MSGLYLFLQLGFVHSEKRFIVECFNYLSILFQAKVPLNPFADLLFCRLCVKLSDQVRASSQTLTIPKHKPENKNHLIVVLAAELPGK